MKTFLSLHTCGRHNKDFETLLLHLPLSINGDAMLLSSSLIIIATLSGCISARVIKVLVRLEYVASRILMFYFSQRRQHRRTARLLQFPPATAMGVL